MSTLWVKFKNNQAVEVPTDDCHNIGRFIEACQKKLPNKLGSIDPDQLFISTTVYGPSLRPGLSLTDIPSQPGYCPNDDEHPLYINVIKQEMIETQVLTNISQTTKTFVDYLKEHNINRPNEKVLATVTMRYTKELDVALRVGNASVLVNLYEKAKELPTSFTRGKIEEQLHVSINCPMSLDQPNILTATNLLNGEAVLIKILKVPETNASITYESRKNAVDAEIYACTTVASLENAENLVKCEVVDIKVEHNEQLNVATGVWMAIKMKHYISALSGRPQYNEAWLFKGFNQIRSGLEAMHNAGLVHMDVKSDNVFIDNSSNWYLGDFGSTRNIGEKMWSITEVLNPYKIPRDTTVIPSFDFVQLCVMIAVELDKDTWKKRLCGNHNNVQEDLIRQSLREIEDENFKAAVMNLFDTHMGMVTDHLNKEL